LVLQGVRRIRLPARPQLHSEQNSTDKWVKNQSKGMVRCFVCDANKLIVPAYLIVGPFKARSVLFDSKFNCLLFLFMCSVPDTLTDADYMLIKSLNGEFQKRL
jgi:hypothetical protein